MGRYPLTARRAITTIVATFVASLAVNVAGAGAVVVNDSGTVAGVSLLPSSRNGALPTGVSAVTSANPCTDPWLASDLGGPSIAPEYGLNGLCYRGGSVIHKNEVFALTWDQHHAYWSQTWGYVEQFLRDVADAKGSLGSPYAVATQYNDGAGNAQNASLFGGGCSDLGGLGSTCEFGGPTGPGHDFPSAANECAVKGDSFVSMTRVLPNTDCLTDAQLQGEVATMVAQTGILGRTTPGYTPLVTLLLPPGVETCLDAARALCSVNAYLNPPPAQASIGTGGAIGVGTYRVSLTYQTASGESVPSAMQIVQPTADGSTITIKSPPQPPATGPSVTGWYAYVTDSNGLTLKLQTGLTPIGTDVTLSSLNPNGAAPTQPAYCSYHSQVNVGGTPVSYVVQPWSAGTGCDEPDAPQIPANATPSQLSVAVGQRLVSPLSQSHIAALVNPAFTGWVAQDGSETDDNHACAPAGNGDDTVTVGSGSQNPYYLQREFNNASVLQFDPWTYFGCAPVVNLSAYFVAPSAINQGDDVQFDGASSPATLIIPGHGFVWDFGDGSAPVTGPSVVHPFAKAGTYTVTLHVTDRGGNTSSYSQVVTVLTTSGAPVPPPSTGGGTGTGTGTGTGKPVKPLAVHLQLMPQSLTSALVSGLRLRVNSNQSADGLVTVSISRQAAKRAHLAVGRSATVVIGRGTVSQVRSGTITLRLGLSRKMAIKLRSLRHVTMTVRLALVPAVGRRMTIVIAGRY